MKKKIYLIIALFGLSVSAMAQADQTLYNIRSIPQSVYLNPAIIPHFKVNIGLPAISSIYANVFNDGFSYKDILSPKDDSTMLFTPDVMLDKMGRRPYCPNAGMYFLSVMARPDILTISTTCHATQPDASPGIRHNLMMDGLIFLMMLRLHW